MKEISLNILDITMNSVKAGAKNIGITIDETDTVLDITITDDGKGMSEQMLANVTDPFCTSRTTRKVGLGVPFYKLAAEMTGGEFSIKSRQKKSEGDLSGTSVRAVFNKSHIDCMPLGDIISTVCVLVQGSPQIDFEFHHRINGKEISLSTAVIRELLGEEISLASPEIIAFIRQSLSEEYDELK